MDVTTDHLLLRDWLESDLEPFAQLNADAQVMEFFPSILSRSQSDQFADRIADQLRANGFGLFAAELRSSRTFIGFIGLSIPRFTAHFTPCVEIGWRLARAHWGRGLATEGARAVVQRAFEDLALPALVSFTVPQNLRSRRIMEKLLMTYDPADDFDHPILPEGHLLRRHVLYRLQRPSPVSSAGGEP